MTCHVSVCIVVEIDIVLGQFRFHWNKTSLYVYLYDYNIHTLCHCVNIFFSCHSVVEYGNRSAYNHFPELETPKLHVCLLNVL